MKKFIATCIIGLISISGLLGGMLNQPKHEAYQPIETEQSKDTNNPIDVTSKSQEYKEKEDKEEVTLESSQEKEETIGSENLKETIQQAEEEKGKEEKGKEEKESKKDNVETHKSSLKSGSTQAPKKVEEVVVATTNKEIEAFYNELAKCEQGTSYAKVIINGKDYKNLEANDLIEELEKSYGINLDNLLNKKEDKPQETRAPEETTPPKATEVKPPSPSTEAPETDSSYEDQVLQLVNKERAKAGLSSLTTSKSLSSAANKRAVEIVKSFSHTRPNGTSFSTVFDEYGINIMSGGENIAYGQKTPEEVVNAWMNSSGHRANILNSKFNKLGVGVHRENGTIYWTQLFTN